MSENFTQVSEVNNYSTMHSLYDYKVPLVNSISKSTFYYNTTQEWNKSPENIKNKTILYGFKKEIKSFLEFQSHSPGEETGQ